MESLFGQEISSQPEQCHDVYTSPRRNATVWAKLPSELKKTIVHCSAALSLASLVSQAAPANSQAWVGLQGGARIESHGHQADLVSSKLLSVTSSGFRIAPVPQADAASNISPSGQEISLREALVKARHLVGEVLISPLDEEFHIHDLRDLIREHPSLLFDIALDDDELINRRAMAARLAVAITPSHSPFASRMAELRRHDSPLIRLGALLGYADQENLAVVKTFLTDPHGVVREEAEIALEDLLS